MTFRFLQENIEKTFTMDQGRACYNIAHLTASCEEGWVSAERKWKEDGTYLPPVNSICMYYCTNRK